MCSIFPAAMERRRWARIICRMPVPASVIYPRKRGIVSSTIAATFTSIRQSRDPSDDGGRRGQPGAAGRRGHRGIENAVMLGFFVVLVAAGIWLLATMADVRKAQDCAAQGRRNCATIEIPDRPR